MENTQDHLKQTQRKKRFRRFIRFAIVTTVMLLSVSTWYYTRFRPSTALIDKFVMINNAIEHSLANLKNTSDNSLKSLKADVKKNGNARAGLEMIKRAEQLKKHTAEMLGEIDKIKQRLINEAGGGLDPQTHTVKRPKDQFYTYRDMIGLPGGEKGMAYKLEKQLKAYNNWVNAEYKDLLKDKLAPLTKVGGAKDTKDFVRHNFRRKPIVLVLAKLSQLQHQVLEDESKVLNKMQSAVPFNEELHFDKIYTGVSAERSVLRSGETYRASMAIAAYPSRTKARMTVNGSPIKVEGGIGKVRFKTTYPLGKKTWKGTITFKNRGRDTTFRIEKEYIVVPRMK
ncbi:hypothetical protein BKI52_29000 [marine bacterium AO1-C]|nr:hypothetical protein BKI52_29000 [marine bacterium AO1-C]